MPIIDFHCQLDVNVVKIAIYVRPIMAAESH